MKKNLRDRFNDHDADALAEGYYDISCNPARLQRKFDACVSDILSLESSKYIRASVIAYSVGSVGTVFMAGSVFSITADKLVPCIILAISAFIGWVLPYLLYRGIIKKKMVQVTPLIDQKYDELYAVCEKNGLLGIWENKRAETEARAVRLPAGNRKGHGDGMGI